MLLVDSGSWYGKEGAHGVRSSFFVKEALQYKKRSEKCTGGRLDKKPSHGVESFRHRKETISVTKNKKGVRFGVLFLFYVLDKGQPYCLLLPFTTTIHKPQATSDLPPPTNNTTISFNINQQSGRPSIVVIRSNQRSFICIVVPIRRTKWRYLALESAAHPCNCIATV